jgi:hypothetical protein
MSAARSSSSSRRALDLRPFSASSQQLGHFYSLNFAAGLLLLYTVLRGFNGAEGVAYGIPIATVSPLRECRGGREGSCCSPLQSSG